MVGKRSDEAPVNEAKLWRFLVDSAVDPAAGPEERREDDDREGELSQLEGIQRQVCDGAGKGFWLLRVATAIRSLSTID